MGEGELVYRAHGGDEDDHGAPGLVHRDPHQQWRVLGLQGCGPRSRYPDPEAEFLNVIGTKVLRVFLLAIHSPPPPSFELKWFETAL